MDSWGQISAEMVKYAIENQNTKQDKIAKISGRSQSSVSEALKRAHFTEIMELENKYRIQLTKLTRSKWKSSLLKLLLAHILGDFFLQPNSWVAEKEKKKLWSGKLYLHIVRFTLP
jgi:predicted transcriptional regulator